METPIASSVRGLQRRYGIDREIIAEEIRAGRLNASQISRRRYLVLHSDFENWLARHPVRANADAEHVEQLLAREESRRAG
jgi:hypothetical protein